MNIKYVFWALVVFLLGLFYLFILTGGSVYSFNNPNNFNSSNISDTSNNPDAFNFNPNPSVKNQDNKWDTNNYNSGNYNSGPVQEVLLSVSGAYYVPNPLKLKKGVPARIVVDLNSVRGCARSIVIPDFGIQKTITTKDNIIEFTPDKTGLFDFGCSMRMYLGKILVYEENQTSNVSQNQNNLQNYKIANSNSIGKNSNEIGQVVNNNLQSGGCGCKGGS